MSYADIEQTLRRGGIVILDGGTGTELERRGVPMDPNAWCGTAALENVAVLEGVHLDYVAAGADIITVNTYASSRLMLDLAGLADHFEEINRTAVGAALRARDASGDDSILVAGSISHRGPVIPGTAHPDLVKQPSAAALADALGELATLLRDEGCDLILLEMMYYPERMRPAFIAATETGLPVWAGFSARRGQDGQALSFAPDREIPLEAVFQVLEEFDVAAAGIMHTPANLVADALKILGDVYAGPLLAYPDSGYFSSPHWRFEQVIPPDEFQRFAAKWIDEHVQIIGGCCGLSPEHIAALGPLKDRGRVQIRMPTRHQLS